MVSGLVTSPCDQLRIFSGDARLMRMASKSTTGFAISNGLERNMCLRFLTLESSTQYLVTSTQHRSFLWFAMAESCDSRNVLKIRFLRAMYPAWFNWVPGTGYWVL